MLNNLNIDKAGAPEDLEKKCNSVKELDLAQNKLENWDEVINEIEKTRNSNNTTYRINLHRF